MAEKTPISVFLAGDSTMASCPLHEAPMAGWGQCFQFLFDEEVIVYNEAAGGRSSNRFIEEGRLENIKKRIQPKDYLLIQFGHNDQKSYGTEPYTTYPFYLKQYVTAAQQAGATPVLLTSVNRRKFGPGNRLENTLGHYPAAVKQLAEDMHVSLIDMFIKTKTLYEEMGEEHSKQLFVWLEEGQHPNYPQGWQDNTHFCEEGALKIARLVADGIKELQLPLAQHLRVPQTRVEA